LYKGDQKYDEYDDMQYGKPGIDGVETNNFHIVDERRIFVMDKCQVNSNSCSD